MIVAVYDNEAGAYQALTSLRSLHDDGDITLYASAVLAKNDKDEVVVIQADEEDYVGTVVGIVSGATVGFLAGPVGAAAGLAIGSLTGFVFDLSKLDTDIDFTESVSGHLASGEVAVIADVEEEWETPVDTELSKNGGIVFRMLRTEVMEEQLSREAEALKKELQALKDKWSKSANDKIAADMITVKQKLKALQKRTDNKIKSVKENMHKKVDNLNQQIKDSSDEKKENLKRRFAQIKSNLDSRNAKLKTAASLTAEALSI